MEDEYYYKAYHSIGNKTGGGPSTFANQKSTYDWTHQSLSDCFNPGNSEYKPQDLTGLSYPSQRDYNTAPAAKPKEPGVEYAVVPEIYNQGGTPVCYPGPAGTDSTQRGTWSTENEDASGMSSNSKGITGSSRGYNQLFTTNSSGDGNGRRGNGNGNENVNYDPERGLRTGGPWICGTNLAPGPHRNAHYEPLPLKCNMIGCDAPPAESHWYCGASEIHLNTHFELEYGQLRCRDLYCNQLRANP